MASCPCEPFLLYSSLSGVPGLSWMPFVPHPWLHGNLPCSFGCKRDLPVSSQFSVRVVPHVVRVWCICGWGELHFLLLCRFDPCNSAFSCHVFLISSDLWQFHSLSVFSCPWFFGRALDQIFWRMFYNDTAKCIRFINLEIDVICSSGSGVTDNPFRSSGLGKAL